MDAVNLIALIINVLVGCTAMPVDEQKYGGQTFLIQRWKCETTNGQLDVKAYRRPCSTGHVDYWGKLVYIEFDQLHIAAYINRFGGVNIGQGASLEEAYLPSCES